MFSASWSGLIGLPENRRPGCFWLSRRRRDGRSSLPANGFWFAAGVGTSAEEPHSTGCPGVVGPVPRPVSMSCRRQNDKTAAGARQPRCRPAGPAVSVAAVAPRRRAKPSGDRLSDVLVWIGDHPDHRRRLLDRPETRSRPPPAAARPCAGGRPPALRGVRASAPAARRPRGRAAPRRSTRRPPAGGSRKRETGGPIRGFRAANGAKIRPPAAERRDFG